MINCPNGFLYSFVALPAKTKSLVIYNSKDLGHYLTADGYIGMGAITYTDTYSRDYGKGNVAKEAY